MRKLIAPLVLAFLILQAQPAEKFALTIDNIMRGPGLVGYEPSQVRWSGDSRQIYFQWKRADQKEEALPDTYVVDRDGSNLRKLSDDEAKSAPPAEGNLSRDRRRMLYSREGALFIYDTTTGRTQQLTRTTDAELNPRFRPDGKSISFTRNNNLYVMSIETGLLVQMTDIRLPPAPGAPG